MGDGREGVHIGDLQAVALAAEEGVKDLEAALGGGNACGDKKESRNEKRKQVLLRFSVAMGRRHRKGRGKS